MPRNHSRLDNRHRTRRVTTAREIRQADQIAALIFPPAMVGATGLG